MTTPRYYCHHCKVEHYQDETCIRDMYRTVRMMDISTGHIQESDVEILEDNSEGLCFSVAQYEEGFYINLANVELDRLPQDCAKFSSAFQHILAQAKKAGFDFINFDRDGEEYEHLPKFDW